MHLPVYDVVLMPGATVYQRCIDASKQLADLGTEFTLQDGLSHPHLSLYMANLTPAHVQQANDLLDTMPVPLNSLWP